MKTLSILALTLVLSFSAYARFEALGHYESTDGSILSLEYSDFQQSPVSLYMMFGADTKFDYLRVANIFLTGEDYKKIFEEIGTFELTGSELQAITGESSIESDGVRKIEFKITHFNNEKRTRVQAIQDFVLITKQGVIQSVSVNSQKRNNGLLLSYGMKTVYESSSEFTQTQAGFFVHDKVLTEEVDIQRALGL